jgi:hypothetical protein
MIAVPVWVWRERESLVLLWNPSSLVLGSIVVDGESPAVCDGYVTD